MKKLLTVLVMMVVVVGVSVVGSIAGVKKIKPGQLKPKRSDRTYSQTTARVSSGSLSQGTYFYAEVKLPRGKVVKKLKYYHESKGATFTQVFLYRTKFGEFDQEVARCSEDTNTGDLSIISFVEDDTIDYAKIQSGYSYWVSAYSSNENSGIRGIEITYK